MHHTSHTNTAFSIQHLSPKQLLCECLDLAGGVLKDLVNTYSATKGLPAALDPTLNDFYKIVNYVLDSTTLENVYSFLSITEANDKYFIRGWLMELKSIRNAWAHNSKLDYRLANRGFDTLELLLAKLGANKQTPLYRKVNWYRKLLLEKTVQELQHDISNQAEQVSTNQGNIMTMHAQLVNQGHQQTQQQQGHQPFQNPSSGNYNIGVPFQMSLGGMLGNGMNGFGKQ